MRIVNWIEKSTYSKSKPDHFSLRYHVDIFDGRKKVLSRVFTGEKAAAEALAFTKEKQKEQKTSAEKAK